MSFSSSSFSYIKSENRREEQLLLGVGELVPVGGAE
jgi:hypothetical protein